MERILRRALRIAKRHRIIERAATKLHAAHLLAAHGRSGRLRVWEGRLGRHKVDHRIAGSAATRNPRSRYLTPAWYP